jgi:hypothetical protein
MKKPTTTALLFFCALAAHAQFFDSLSRPSAWFRADRSVLTATKWTDVGGNKRDATAALGQGPATGGTINFNKAILFDGASDYLTVPVNLEALQELAILAVFQSSDTTERGLWGTENALSRSIMLTTRKAMGPDTSTVNYGKNENRALLSTIAQSWQGTLIKSTTAFLALGSAGKLRGHKPFKGSVAELMVFSRALGFLERLQIETYLALKYGASMPGSNYISSDGKVLWKAEENTTYSHRVAGIGRDDAFQLYQKQSRSAYDSGLLTMSVGSLAASNDDNKAVIDNGNFLVWGDDNASRAAKPGVGKDSVLSMVQRKWLLTASGNTIAQQATELQVDVSRFSKTVLGYWLVIDRSGRGDFSVDNLEYILPDRVTSDGKAIYKITWDTDHSGKDSFGFARARNLFAVVRTLTNPSCTNETAGHIRIEMVAGQAPYQYKLTNRSKLSREWSAREKTAEQKELVQSEYALSIKDNSGEALARNFALKMPDALTIDLGADQKLTLGSEIVMDVKPQVPDSVAVKYLWENNFGFSSATGKVSITESGIYKVTVTKQSDGCAFSDEVAISGAEEQKFAVYPTVINKGEVFNVSISLPEVGSVGVEVFDLKGMAHQTMNGEGSSEYQFKIALSTSGMYVVVLRTPRGTWSRKVIMN